MNIFNRAISAIVTALSSIITFISVEFAKLRFVGEGIKRHEKITDFIEVFKPTRFYFLFNLLSLVVFIFLPQGKDVLLIVIEDLSIFSPWSLLSLLIGVTGWGIVAEFGVRYKLYVSDNSAFSLSSERVEYRKQLQDFFSMFYLILPFLIVILSTIIVSLTNISSTEWTNYKIIWPFITTLIILILLLRFIVKFYFDRNYIENFNERFPILSGFLKLPKEEANWAKKLFGIYSNYVFQVRKENVYIYDNNVKQIYEEFIREVKAYSKEKNDSEGKSIIVNSFPDENVIPKELPPFAAKASVFRDEEYLYKVGNKTSDETGVIKKKELPLGYVIQKKIEPNGFYRWIYENDASFYKTLHKQVHVISITCFIMIILISSGFILSPQLIGSPALVCLSFGCWQGVYTGLLYIDSRYKRKFSISVRWAIIAWVFIISFINNDHPVRYNQEGITCDNRVELANHFQQWLSQRTDTNYISVTRRLNSLDLPCDSSLQSASDSFVMEKRIPVIFVTAEGGALRTGAFTGMLLAALQDSFNLFKNDIYAFSTVSGGGVGVGFFNAVAYLQDEKPDSTSGYYRDITRQFFSYDQLSPVLSKFFYGDVLNSVYPYQIEKFDRAIALEHAWEKAYETVFTKAKSKNVFSSYFEKCFAVENIAPAWFINTTEVETGLQCFISNVKPPYTNHQSFLFAAERDLLKEKMRGGINYSTAVNFSTRFPLVSPSAAVQQSAGRTYHYVDGGYVENTGSKTMFELMQYLKDSIRRYTIPYVIQLRFGDDGDFNSTDFLNEVNSILYGIYNTRSGNSTTYSEMLKNFTQDSLHGVFIKVPLPATSSEVPMSWVLSERTMKRLDQIITDLMQKNTTPDYKPNELYKLYFFDTGYTKNHHKLTKVFYK